MNNHDVVRVKKSAMATPDLEDEPIEIQSGWEGIILAYADKPTPCIWFDNESYRGKPFVVDLDAANLEVVWANPVKIRIRIDENGREWTNPHDWLMAEYARLNLTPEQITERRQKAQEIIDSFYLNEKKLNERGEGWVNAREWLMAEFARRRLTPEQIKGEMQEAKDFIDSHPNPIKTKK